MMMLTIAALATGLLADGSVRAEARGGTAIGGQDPDSAAVSADLQARASNADGALGFGLSPSAVLAQSRQVFVRASGEADLRLGGRGWARLRQRLGYGSVDLSPLSPAPAATPSAGPTPVQPPPGSRFVSVEESNTSLELDLAASRRLRMFTSAAWGVSGGADAEARASLPLSRGPVIHAGFDWSATHLDTLGMELAALDTRYSNDRRASVASLTATWRSQLSRATVLSLALGPAIGRARAGDQPATTIAYAAGSAELRATLMRGLLAAVGTSVEPLGDANSGELVERGSLRAFAIWDRHRGAAVMARLMGSLTLTSGSGSPTSPQAGDRYLQGELSATVPLGARSSLAAGARAAFLSRPVLNQPSAQWVAFATYAAQFPLLR